MFHFEKDQFRSIFKFIMTLLGNRDIFPVTSFADKFIFSLETYNAVFFEEILFNSPETYSDHYRLLTYQQTNYIPGKVYLD